ncbi:hypothetical protein [Streptomyces paludis]|uniref:PPE domain-containing protein n=1 Tax=Streptomyces paludis TaxID=2282738 RepID=A0A345HV86_9ACTN|nr:hypothetical protein [Streptomyces paludis]AXG80610.1 hypothetical protein DVK44_26345 [Streptomyces paludis]
MSDEKTQRADDNARVDIRNSQIDIARSMASSTPDFSGGGQGQGRGGGPAPGPFASTSFEGHDLNEMISLVNSANHADLVSAGQALWAARDALKDAASELKDYVDAVDWTGQASDSFESFGKALTTHALSLSDFADVAGTQIAAAGSGLAEVRTAMPPGDSRLVRKKVEDFQIIEKTSTNKDYAEAVKVEAHRQEAINQMYRLASFYAVSEETLAAQQPPEFGERAPGEVPRPKGGVDPGPGAAASAQAAVLQGAATPQSASGRAEIAAAGVPRSGSPESVLVSSPGKGIDAVPDGTGIVPRGEASSLPGGSTSLEINSVAAPANPTTNATPLPTSTANGAPTSVSAPGFSPPYPSVNPAQGAAVRSSGPAGAASTSRATGRAPIGGSGNSAGGRPGVAGSGPVGMGRGGAAGQTPAAGRPGPVGRQGVVGGSPRAAGGSAGSRMPRGTVVGGEGNALGRAPSGGIGQRGVVGANPAKGAARPGGRGTASSNGVVGTPRGGSKSGAGFTQGGAGLVRGPAGRKDDKNEPESTGSSRPDYLTEDEETWTGKRRGAVPPVVE